jgi:hypothetical protein
MMEVKHGTLITDCGKVGMIVKIYKVGATNNKATNIIWHETYEIYYADGSVAFINKDSFEGMIKLGTIKILSPHTLMPHSLEFFQWQ